MKKTAIAAIVSAFSMSVSAGGDPAGSAAKRFESYHEGPGVTREQLTQGRRLRPLKPGERRSLDKEPEYMTDKEIAEERLSAPKTPEDADRARKAQEWFDRPDAPPANSMRSLPFLSS